MLKWLGRYLSYISHYNTMVILLKENIYLTENLRDVYWDLYYLHYTLITFRDLVSQYCIKFCGNTSYTFNYLFIKLQ